MEKMTARDMRKLSRSEILEMMLLQAEEIEKLKAENGSLKEQLNNRTIAIGKAGTMAEASILINNVLSEADKAAKDYLMNIKQANGDLGSDVYTEPVIPQTGITSAPKVEAERKEETATLNPQPQTTSAAVNIAENKEQEYESKFLVKRKEETATLNPQPKITLGAPVSGNNVVGGSSAVIQENPQFTVQPQQQAPVLAPSVTADSPKVNTAELGAVEVKENMVQPQQQAVVVNTAEVHPQPENDFSAHWDEVSAKMAAFYKEHKKN